MKTFAIKLVLTIIAAALVAGGVYFAATTIRKDKAKTEGANTDHSMMGHDMNSKSADKSHRGYSLQMTSSTDGIKPGQPTKISFKVLNDKGAVLKDFTVGHEKLLHFIVVRKDLQDFQHLHPDFNSQTGEFSVNVSFPSDGPYRVFPDFIPTPENPQKLAVTLDQDLIVGDQAKYKAQAATADKQLMKTVDGFNVNYNFPDNLKAGSPIEYTLIVEMPGSTVKLEPYLGAMGHSVIIKEGSLDYIHAHAMDMNMSGMDHEMGGGVITFDTSFPEPGIYKLFTQFQVSGKVETSEYTIKVN